MCMVDYLQVDYLQLEEYLVELFLFNPHNLSEWAPMEAWVAVDYLVVLFFHPLLHLVIPTVDPPSVFHFHLDNH